MEKSYTVYMHINKTNGKKYIGITCRKPEKRWDCGNGYLRNEHFYKAIKKYGWDKFEHKILADSLSEADAAKMECDLIAFHRSIDPKFGYNKTTGGEAGKEFSEETIRKMSEAQHGSKNHLFGVSPSKETRAKISAALQGKKVSEETRKKLSRSLAGKRAGEKHPLFGKTRSKETKQKISNSRINKYTGSSNSFYGRKHSKETIAKMKEIKMGKYSGNKNPMFGKRRSENTLKKMSLAKVGKYAGRNNQKANTVINLDTCKIFTTIKEASEFCGVSPAGVSACCRGKQKSAGKHPETVEPLHWMYYEDYLKIHNLKEGA